MKKTKRPTQGEPPPKGRAATTGKRRFVWWPWAVALAALLIVFEIYAPALNGPFVLDDRYLMFGSPRAAVAAFKEWVQGARPLLMYSYWLNYQLSASDPYSYHVINVILHFLGSVVAAFV